MSLTFDNKVVTERLAEWTSAAYDEATRAELQALVEAGRKDELEDRFYRTLAFGTGGLRGKIGAGTNRMNSYIVARATQGLANYVKAHATAPGPLRVAIAHDCRNRSREFAEVTAEVMAANGFYVHISPELRPTPYLSYALRRLGCHTGIVVTASHNPKEYNGYKVYWDDGSQVVPPHDEGIIAEVEKVQSEADVRRILFSEGVARGMIKVMGQEMDNDYLSAVLRQRVSPEVIAANQPKIVYTPLHGAGATLAPRALREWGFRDVLCEPEQMKPDGNFPTAASPNPEEGAALDRAIQLARKEGADLVLATDPDADRLGIAVRSGEEFVLLTGNQTGALIADYLLGAGTKNNKTGKQLGMVTTVVTSPLVQRVAESHGAACPLVLTGFKWIALQLRQWLAANGPHFVYGTEESYGHLIGEHCRDKDGIVAACVVAEMAAHAKAQGLTLLEKLHDIYQRLGVYYEWQKSITLPGVAGAAKIQAMLESVRRNPPAKVGARVVTRFTRLDTGEVIEPGRPTTKVDLPPSDVYTFDLEGGTRAIVRPSGTEPKIKFYFFLRDGRRFNSRAEVAARIEAFRPEAKAFEADVLAALGIEG